MSSTGYQPPKLKSNRDGMFLLLINKKNIMSFKFNVINVFIIYTETELGYETVDRTIEQTQTFSYKY